MDLTPTAVSLIIVAYLMGSASTAIIVCRLMGFPDPRTQGSGNPGATNVLRYGGKKAAIIVLLGDMLKGLLPVAAAQWLGLPDGTLALVALAAFLGHLYPVFFRFQGGKGVATALGVMLGLSWPAGLAVLATWLVTAYVSRYSSAAALTATAFAPLYVWLIVGSAEILAMVIIMGCLLIWRHRSNIRKLLNSSEGRIGK
jgi:glycerol-3-phosphate acyltransferase PlsY